MHEHHRTHAVNVLAAIARVPSLAGGVVTFDARDLGGGRWWHQDDDIDRGPTVVWCPVPAFDNERELLAVSRRAVELGLEDNAELRRWLDEGDERRRNLE